MSKSDKTDREKQFDRISQLNHQYQSLAKALTDVQKFVPVLGNIEELTEGAQQKWLDETERTFQQLIISTEEELFWWRRWVDRARKIQGDSDKEKGIPF